LPEGDSVASQCPNILLVRHGRSAHKASRLLDLAKLVRWRDAYEAAGIDERDRSPALKAKRSRNWSVWPFRR